VRLHDQRRRRRRARRLTEAAERESGATDTRRRRENDAARTERGRSGQQLHALRARQVRQVDRTGEMMIFR
jgi:hypothetical protein